MLKITRADLQLVRELNHRYFGNHLGEHKSFLIQNRLKKLFRSQNRYVSISQMLQAVDKGEFIQEFINTFTTNKTSFFREMIHFEDLISRVFAEHFTTETDIAIYSCAASTGEEPYSIAMTLLHYLAQHSKNPAGMVYATDIDTHVLKIAQEGIYRFNESDSPFPKWIQPQRFFQRRLLEKQSHMLIRINDTLRRHTQFRQHNLLSRDAPFGTTVFDVIFCRNVLIYFNERDQEFILEKLFHRLKIGGTLYTGHSETPISLYPYVEKIGPSIFKKHSELP